MMFKNKSQAQVSLDIATQRTGEKPVLASRVKDTPKSVVREYTEALLVALLLALFIRSFVVQAFKTPVWVDVEHLAGRGSYPGQ